MKTEMTLVPGSGPFPAVTLKKRLPTREVIDVDRNPTFVIAGAGSPRGGDGAPAVNLPLK